MMKKWLIGFLLFLVSTYAFAVEVTVDGKKIDLLVCGGFAGVQCSDTQWCDFPSQSQCGLADQFGTCRPRPAVCTQHFMPVCGCDGKTHSNSCMAAAAGVDVAYVGNCRQGEKTQ